MCINPFFAHDTPSSITWTTSTQGSSSKRGIVPSSSGKKSKNDTIKGTCCTAHDAIKGFTLRHNERNGLDTTSGTYKIQEEMTVRNRLEVPKITLPDDVELLGFKSKRSFSFGGFGALPSAEITKEELESFLDSRRKEPSTITKAQIKIYAQKYKDFKADLKPALIPWYKGLIEHTQPAHFVTIVAFVYLAFRLFPDARRSQTEASTLTRLLYVSSISAVFGTQFWMTFVSGLALFFSVSRHTFASVQSVLFPLYFLVNAFLTLIAIITYTQHYPTHLWNTHQLIQGMMLVVSFFVNLVIRLYLAPILTKLITIKVAIEKEAGLGTEIGTNQPGLLSGCPHYMKLHRAFRKTHMAVAIGNMTAMAATSFHLYYLATKLCSGSI